MTMWIDAAVRFAVSVLLNGLWEAALIAAVAWLALRAMPNGNATTRHTVLSAALLCALVAPVVTAALAAVPAAAPATVASPQVVPPQAHRDAAPPLRVHPVPNTKASSQAQPVPAPPLAAPLPHVSVPLPRPVAIAIVALWLAGAAFVLLRLVLSLMHLERLKTDALPVAVEYRAQLLRWTAATKGSREVRLCRSDEIEIPIAVGLFDAMILVPERLLEELPPADIDRIVLHELAHLRRGDDWINAIERVAQALLFFNPGILWIVSQLDLEREVACDDWVLQQNEPLPYATCLAKVVESATWPYRAMSAPGAFVTRRGMSIRIERLLSSHRDVRIRTSLAPAGVALTLFAALGLAAALVSPSIAYTGVTPPEKQAPAIASKTATAAAKAAPATSASAKSAAIPAATAAPALAASHAPVAARQTTAQARVETQVATEVRSETDRTVAYAPVAASPVSVAATSSDYIDELAAAGYTNLSIDELIRLRAVGVTGEYVRELSAAGLGHPPIDVLVRLRALGVTPEFAGDMRRLFGGALDADQISRLRATGVSADYVESMRSHFGSGFGADDAVRMHATGVTPSYVAEMASAGYPNLTLDQVEHLRVMGIDAAYVRLAAAHGFKNLPVEQLLRLKESGLL